MRGLVASVVALLAAGVWLGGLLVLGAIVAPTVFREVPAPDSANAMTLVFTRFDKLAMLSAAVVAVAEGVRMRAVSTSTSRIDVARIAAIALAGLLAAIQGLWLSPTIVALHEGGAVRGSGPAGERLERFHAWSETCGKTEVLLLVVVIALLVHAARERR